MPAQAEIVKCTNNCKISDLVQTVLNLINFLLSWSAIVAMVFIVWAGWQMIVAGGNSEAIEAGKTSLTNAIIGFFLIMTAFVLLNFVVALLTGDKKFGADALIEAYKLAP